ncbi:PREDICTED: probable cytochrome P450 309a1 [Drosophila arizonae]|uniref:Probable cytochrome P450 309a1 n=1 Tax=Drosophila arizonae TaxID=7263 RepID=A0ABM1NNW5_DROAR|nr:PREDICTED: probable cytochrome P450 309a1 [Drosophila arizonae]
MQHAKWDKYARRNPFWASGDTWRRLRSEAQAGLSANRLKRGYSIWEQSGRKLTKYMTEQLNNNMLETRDLCFRYTADVMCDFIWGIDAGTLTRHTGEPNKVQQMASKWTNYAFYMISIFMASIIAPFTRLLLRLRFYPKDTDEFFSNLTKESINLRLKTGEEPQRVDYLSHLLKLRDEKNASHDDLVGHALTVMLDGYDTTGTALLHALYYLSEFPSAQQKLRMELRQNTEHEKSLDYDKLSQLPYLEQVVYESLRLSSLIPQYTKICTESTFIQLSENRRVEVEEGMTVMIPNYQFHHDAKYFPDPEAFRPERFNNGEHIKMVQQGILLPFSDGPRICMGMRLALLTLKSALFHIISNYQIVRSKQKIVTDGDSGFGVVLQGDINLEYRRFVRSSNRFPLGALNKQLLNERAAVMWTLIGVLLGIVHVAFAAVYLYLTWFHSYWTKRGLVTAQPLTLLGSYPGLFGGGSSFIEDIGKIYNKYKGKERAVGVFLTRQPQILVLDPQLAHEVLVTNFSDFRDTVTSSYVTHSKDYDKYVSRNPFFSAGDEWKKHRVNAGAGLTPNKLKQAYAIWEQTGEKLVSFMQSCIEERGSNIIETRDLCYRYTAQAMGDFIWGIDAGSLTGSVKETSSFQRISTEWVTHAFLGITRFNRTTIAPIVRRLFRMRFFTQAADDFYLKLTRDAAKLRQSGSGGERSDYLAHLLQLQEKGASLDDMVGHAMTVLMDGFETSSAVLYHMLYTLGAYPEQQEKLRSEILTALGVDKCISYEQLNALPYLDQCVYESMRMTSVIGFLLKICTRPTKMDLGNDKILNVEPGVTVAIPAYHFHHDEAYFPQPDEFRPERFDNEAISELTKRGCLLAFGDGPRICLGMRVGLLSVKMALLRILSQYKIEQTNKLSLSSDSGLGMYLDGDVDLRYTRIELSK